MGLPRPTRAAILALFLLIAAEAGARLLIDRGVLHYDQTLDRMIRDYENQVTAPADSTPSIWFLGNSTLERGVKEAVLEDEADASVSKLSHGSASFRAIVSMFDRYCRLAPKPPSRVLLLTTIDDFNLHGVRAQSSRRYLEYRSPLEISPTCWSALVGSRIELGKLLLQPVYEAAAHPASASPGAEAGRNPIPEDHIRRLASDFEFDESSFERLQNVAASHGAVRTTVVLLPVSRQYIRIHDAAAPKWTAQRVRRAVSEACRSHGLEFSDQSSLFTDDRYFVDGFHARSRGAAILTHALAGILAAR